jgi:hypothetical protein
MNEVKNNEIMIPMLIPTAERMVRLMFLPNVRTANFVIIDIFMIA